MGRNFFALLVGIDDYPANVSNLQGCVNDVNHLNDYLKEHVALNRCIETLTNSEATRENVIRLFRQHLGKAGENDVALFHYSGHGSRELTAPEFGRYSSYRKGETLVCYDSRSSGGHDLADKELAVLLWEVAKKNPHLVVSLDCCHSGSGTRWEPDDSNIAAVREIPGRFEDNREETPRPLESYLEGFYKNMDSIHIPQSRHVLMAACDRHQRAYESKDHRGFFSAALVEVLTKSDPDISYADLFVRIRAAILKQVDNQTPQFETFSHFMPYTKFLDGRPLEKRARYHVYFEKGDWRMDSGALHGLATEAEKVIEVALYPESTGDRAADKTAGFAKVSDLGAQKSTLRLDFETSREARYYAEIISLPVPPLPVLLEGDDQGKTLVKNSLPQGANFVFTDEPGIAKYALSVQKGRFLLSQENTGLLIQGAEGEPGVCCKYMFSILERVIRWERSLVLQNHKTALNPGELDFKFFQVLENGTERECQGDPIILDFVNTGDGWKEIRSRLRVRNRAPQKLYVTLVYFSEKFGIYILRNEPLLQGNDEITLWGEGEKAHIKLPDGIDENVDTFKLLVSTEPVDDFLLMQPELELGKILSNQELMEMEEETQREKMRKIANDWFTKTLTVKTVRQLNQPGDKGEMRQSRSKCYIFGQARRPAPTRTCRGDSLWSPGSMKFDFNAVPGDKGGDDHGEN
jgi:hypothetical protein